MTKNSKNTNQSMVKNSKSWSHWLIIILVIGLITLIVFMIAWFKPTQDLTSAAQKTTTSPATNTPSASMALPTEPTTHPTTDNLAKPLPKSLQNTQVDGEIIIDENKQLVVTAGLRRLFDYFLSAQGEESLDDIKKRVTAYIRSHTPEPASSQAEKLFQQYLDYLKAVAELDHSLNKKQINTDQVDLNSVKNRLNAIKQLQAKFFDEKTQVAFFGDEQALNAYTLQTVQINQNTQLSAEQREKAIADAKNTYIASFKDPNVQNQLRQQQNIEKLLAETEKLQQQGASQSEINAMRSKYVSTDAVKRLEQLDIAEAEFDKRLNDYKNQRQQLINQFGHTPQADEKIIKLQQSLFTPEEQLRLDVLTK